MENENSKILFSLLFGIILGFIVTSMYFLDKKLDKMIQSIEIEKK